MDEYTTIYLSVLEKISDEYIDSDIYLHCEHVEEMQIKDIERALWRRFYKKDKIEYLEGLYNSCLIELETPAQKRLAHFLDENMNAFKTKFGTIEVLNGIEKFKPFWSTNYDENFDFHAFFSEMPNLENFKFSDIGNFPQKNLANQKYFLPTKEKIKNSTFIFHLANESDKLFFVSEENLLDLIIHLYFKEKHLQWLIDMIDFVSEDERVNNENNKVRLWIDGVECKGNKKDSIIDESKLKIQLKKDSIFDESKLKIQLKKGAKVDLIRIIVAMYDNGFFEGETKQKVDLINVMNTLGDVLGVDLSDYDNSLSTGFLSKIETNLKVFDTLKQAIQKRYNKRLEK